MRYWDAWGLYLWVDSCRLSTKGLFGMVSGNTGVLAGFPSQLTI